MRTASRFVAGRRIDEAEAATVLRIFREFAAGRSPPRDRDASRFRGRLVPDNGRLEIELAGDLAGILALVAGNKKPASIRDGL